MTTIEATRQDEATQDARVAGLRRFNAGAGVLHLVQGVAMILLSSATSIAVTGTWRSSSPRLGASR